MVFSTTPQVHENVHVHVHEPMYVSSMDRTLAMQIDRRPKSTSEGATLTDRGRVAIISTSSSPAAVTAAVTTASREAGGTGGGGGGCDTPFPLTTVVSQYKAKKRDDGEGQGRHKRRVRGGIPLLSLITTGRGELMRV